MEDDEESGHEDEPGSLEWIAKSSGCQGNVYLIRVSGGEDTKNSVCTRSCRGSLTYYQVTPMGAMVAEEVADAIKQRIMWIGQGLSPDESNDRPSRILYVGQHESLFRNTMYITAYSIWPSKRHVETNSRPGNPLWIESTRARIHEILQQQYQGSGHESLFTRRMHHYQTGVGCSRTGQSYRCVPN